MERAYSGTTIRAEEQPLLDAGRGPAMMTRAAHGVFACLREMTEKRRRTDPANPARVVGLIGKGNNGADTLYALVQALRSGLEASAIVVFDRVHEAAFQEFLAAGGRALTLDQGIDDAVLMCLDADVLIDGILGTGAHGGLGGAAADLVAQLADSSVPVLACDIPSGVDANTGEVNLPVLAATNTVTFGGIKTGLWVDPGASYAGRIQVSEIGLKDLDAREPSALRAEVADLSPLFAPPARAAHKYSFGTLEIAAGSIAYPGAAFLSTHGALATGVGMLNYVGEDGLADMLVQEFPSVVLGSAKREPDALVVGPGIDLSQSHDYTLLHSLLERRQNSAIVLDAQSVNLFTVLSEAQRARTLLTPHAGELAALLAHHDDVAPTAQDINERPWYWAHRARDLTGTAVLLKGFVTLVVPSESGAAAHVQHADTTRLAVAGSGDVLAGIAGAIAATNRCLSMAEVGAYAALLHSRAGWFASRSNTVPINASALAGAIPEAIFDARTLGEAQAGDS